MYAVIANGGKQYQVAEGDVIRLEKCAAQVGEQLELPEVLLVSDGSRNQ